MKRIPIIHAFILFLAWVCITFFNSFFTEQGNIPLKDVIGKGFNFQIFFAALLLLTFVFFYKAYKTTGINKAIGTKNWILIYPVTIISICLGLCIYKGIFHSTMLAWVIVNTFFVGISEELMFRGILLGSLIRKYSFWTSILIISILFGSTHILNGFTTGDFVHAFQQAFFATFSGFLFVAIRVKTQSIIPAIIVHWLWDMVVFFIMSLFSKDLTDFSTSTMEEQIITVLLLASPFIFGITGIIQLLNKKVIAEFSDLYKKS